MRTKAPPGTSGVGSSSARPRSSSAERSTLVHKVLADIRTDDHHHGGLESAATTVTKVESMTASSSAVIRRVVKSNDPTNVANANEEIGVTSAGTHVVDKTTSVTEKRNSALLSGSRTAILAPMTSTLSHLMSQVQINCETMEESGSNGGSTCAPPPVLPRRKPKMENPLAVHVQHPHPQTIQNLLPQQLQQLWKVELLDTSGESGYGTDNSDSNSLRSQDSCEPAPPPLPRRKPRRRVQFDSYVLLIQSLKERDMEGILSTIFNVSPEALCTEDVIFYFHTAILRQDYEMTELLVRAGAEVNTFDHRGWSALHCACSVARLDMIKLLLQNGAAVLARTHHSSETGTQLLPQDNPAFPQCLAYLRCMEECLGTVNSRIALAAANYKACRIDELSIRKGERLVVVRRGDLPNNEMWWWLRSSSGKEGYVLRDLLALNSRYST